MELCNYNVIYQTESNINSVLIVVILHLDTWYSLDAVLHPGDMPLCTLCIRGMNTWW